MGNQFLSLSLFIMLLSFFIVLNAMSTIEQTKSYPVLNSLSLAFAKKESLEASDSGLVDTQDTRNVINQQQKAGSALVRMQGIFDANIAGVETAQNRFGNTLYAQVDIDDFENALYGQTPTALGGAKFTPMLLSVFNAPDGAAHRMDIALYTANDFNARDGDIARLQNMASALARAGLPPERFSIGISRGAVGKMGLRFHRQFDDVSLEGDDR